MAPSSKSTCRSRCVLAEPLSFKTQHVCAKPGRRCVEACRAKRRHAVTHRGQGLGTDMLTHPARRISYSETAAHARSCCRKKFQCPSFKYDSTFLTCLSRAHSPLQAPGFLPTRLSRHRRRRVRDSLRALHADSTDQPHAAVCRLLPLREPRPQARSSDLYTFVRETCTHLYARL